VVAIIPDHDIETLKETVIHNYEKKIGCKPTFYEVKITDGTQEIGAL
jgi:galactokinase